MITVENLRAYGAGVDEGLRRCMNNEAFYLKMVGKAVATMDVAGLRAALEAGETDKAFQICHSIKGVAGNLSLTPLFGPAGELTELLRARVGAAAAPAAAAYPAGSGAARPDASAYLPLLEAVEASFAALKALEAE